MSRSIIPVPALLLLIVSGLLGGCAASEEIPWKAGDAYLIRMRLNEGDAFRAEISNEQTIQMDMMGRQMDITQRQTMIYRYDVTEVAEDGTMLIGTTLDRIQMHVETPMGAGYAYDSADTSSAPQGLRILTELLDHTLTMRMTPTGDIVEVQGMEALIERMRATMDSTRVPFADSVRTQMKRLLGGRNAQQMFGAAFQFYPDRPVTVKDTWSASYGMASIIPVQIDAVYTLRAVDTAQNQAVLDFSADVSTEDSTSTMDMGPMSMTVNLSGTQTGTLHVDLPTGLVTHSTIQHDFAGDAAIETSMQQSQTMSMDMAITGTTTMTVERLP